MTNELDFINFHGDTVQISFESIGAYPSFLSAVSVIRNDIQIENNIKNKKKRKKETITQNIKCIK